MPAQRGADLVDLDLLVSVADTGSLGRTARRHGLSQPAVSMRMTGLERRLGLELLRRHPSGTALTDAGMQVVEASRKVLAAADWLEAVAERMRAADGSHLRVAASFTVAEHLLPSWIGAIRQELPGVGLALDVVNSTHVLDSVIAGRADIGFVEGVGDPVPGLRTEVITTDELVVVVAPGHPWAESGRPVGGAELASTELVVREEGSGTRQVLDRALAEWGGARTRLELGSSTALLAAARRGDSPAVLSVLAAASDIVAGHLVAVPTAGIDLTRQIRAVWSSAGGLGAMARRLLATAEADPGSMTALSAGAASPGRPPGLPPTLTAAIPSARHP